MPSSRAEGFRCPSLRIGTHDSRDRGGIGDRVPVPEMVQHLCEGRNGVARDFIIVEEQGAFGGQPACCADRSEEHTSELQSLMRISYAVFCLKKKRNTQLHIVNRNN